MRSDNDKKAAMNCASEIMNEMRESESPVLPIYDTHIFYAASKAFLAGCAHKEKQLEAEREQIVEKIRSFILNCKDTMTSSSDPDNYYVNEREIDGFLDLVLEQRKQKERIG